MSRSWPMTAPAAGCSCWPRRLRSWGSSRCSARRCIRYPAVTPARTARMSGACPAGCITPGTPASCRAGRAGTSAATSAKRRRDQAVDTPSSTGSCTWWTASAMIRNTAAVGRCGSTDHVSRATAHRWRRCSCRSSPTAASGRWKVCTSRPRRPRRFISSTRARCRNSLRRHSEICRIRASTSTSASSNSS